MKRRKGFGYAKYGYLFSIPFIVVYLIFSFYPTIFTALLGFTDSKGLGNTSFHFLKEPFQNFILIWNNKSFQTSLSNTVTIWLMNFIPQILLALLLTEWFTNTSAKLRGVGLFKVAYYMPNIITAASIAILFYALFGYPMGPVNSLLKMLGLQPYDFLISKTASQGIVAFIQFWMWYGYTMIILISGVLGINPEIFEAANIDGANRAQVFFRVTIPNLRTILLYMLITSMIGGLQMFDIPRLFHTLPGGPDNATLTTSLFIYNQAFSGSYLYNRAAAASMMMFVIIAFASALIFFIMRDKGEVREAKQRRQLIRDARQKAKLARGESR